MKNNHICLHGWGSCEIWFGRADNLIEICHVGGFPPIAAGQTHRLLAKADLQMVSGGYLVCGGGTIVHGW
jgi:hypothetical protein